MRLPAALSEWLYGLVTSRRVLHLPRRAPVAPFSAWPSAPVIDAQQALEPEMGRLAEEDAARQR